MKAKRWNYETQSYDPCEIPDGSKSYSADMDEIITCASCGKRIRFGDAYGSPVIHGGYGFSFMVCKDCYEEEMKIELAERRKRG